MKNKVLHIFLAVALLSSAMFCSCKSSTSGYDFENVVKKDYADMVDTYGDGVEMYIACGLLNHTYGEIRSARISPDSICFTDMFTLFQAGDTVVEITHLSGCKTPIVSKNEGQWMDCQPITPETDMSAMDALSMFLASGAADDSTCAPPFANNVVLRLPSCMKGSRYCYLFGYDSVFTILDEHGNIVRCSE